MLDDEKKREERALATIAAVILCEEWSLVASESPDFIVNGRGGSFGLEVTSCFSGNYKKSGSVAAKGARYRQKKLNEIRERCLGRFPEIKHWSLEYINDWQDDDVETHIVSAIESAREDGRTGSFCFPISGGSADEITLLISPKILINKQPHFLQGDAWRNMNDYAGPLEVSSLAFQRSIDKKSGKIAVYRQKFPDIRLIVSAFSLTSSGNVSIDKDFIPNIRGFDRVYFMHVPNYVVEFPSGSVKTMTGHTPESLSWRPKPSTAVRSGL
jgi:hypothetical protein